MRRSEWRQIRRRGHLKRLGPFMLVALLVYLFVLPAIWTLLPEREKAPDIQPVEMRRLSQQQWQQNTTRRSADKQPATPREKRLSRKEPPKKEKEPEKVEKPKGQIVELAKPQQEEKPDEAKYISQYDSKVEKETKARERRPSPKVAATPQPQKTPPSPPVPDQPEPDEVKPDQIAISEQPDASKPGPKVQESLMLLPKLKMENPLKLEDDGTRGTHKNREGQDVSVEGNAERLAMMIKRRPDDTPPGEPGARLPTRIPRSLLPSLSTAVDSAGMPMSDYLPNVEQGDGTWLNSHAFKYATFFNRIKRKIATQWHPAQAQRRFDPSFAIHGYQSRYTVLYIVLDSSGNLVTADIQRSCGVDFLDQEAVSAVTAAAPFPNPPPGVVEEDGNIRFPFGFYFQIRRSGLPLVGQ